MPFNNQADQTLRESTRINNRQMKRLQSDRRLTNIKSIYANMHRQIRKQVSNLTKLFRLNRQQDGQSLIMYRNIKFGRHSTTIIASYVPKLMRNAR